MTRRFGNRVRGDQDKFDREAYDDCDTGDSRRARRFTDARHEVRKTQRQQRGGDEELEGLHPQRFTEDRSIIDNDQENRHNRRDGIDECESELEPIQGETRHATTLKKGNTGGAEGIRTPDLLIANETRYQLRHSPGKHVRLAAGLLAGCPSGFFIPQGRQLGGVLARRHVARSRPQLVSVIL